MMDGEIKAVRFLMEVTWESLPERVRAQALKCAVDLCGALAAGTMTKTAGIMADVARAHFPGDTASLALGGRASLPGAALANGFAQNAFDVDDGHRLIKGHPGAAVFPALLAAAEFRNATLEELLTALAASYEVAIRAGLALHRHYNFYHGSGSWGAVGSAAGVSRLLGLSEDQAVQALGAAEYHAPLAPVMRPVAHPTMNKDGIGWGNMAGMLAALMAREGFTGAPSVLGLPEAADLVDSLGSEYKIMELYFKPYTCCRWAHPSVSAAIGMKKRYGLTPGMVKSVSILTFGAAAALYTKKPANTEEAQYNVLYPVAAALAAGEVGPRQVLEGYIDRPDVLSLMDRMRIESDERFESVFPSKRLCEVEIALQDGRVLRSGVYGPMGEPEEPVSMEWVQAKFRWLTSGVLDKSRADAVIALLTGDIARGRAGELAALLQVK